MRWHEIFCSYDKMPEKQSYTTAVSKAVSLATIRDIRENEQSVQAFTQLPPLEPAGAHDLFLLFTAEIIKEEKVFTR